MSEERNTIPWYDAVWNLVLNFLMMYGFYKIFLILRNTTHWSEWIWMVIAILFLLLCKK